jgi:hypothetical protein
MDQKTISELLTCHEADLHQRGVESAGPDELASKTSGKFDDASPNLLPCNIWQ